MQVRKLDNGLLLVVDRYPSPVAAVVVGVGVGSLYEDAEKRGVTHLLEHMLFYPEGFDVDAAVERLGGENNAFTSRDNLAIVLESLAESAVGAVELAYRIYSSPKFDFEKFEKEKLVVLSELRLSREDPSDRVGELAVRALFGDSDWGDPVGGLLHTVEGLGAEDLARHRETWFVPDSTVVALAGGVGEDAVKKAEELFGKLEGPPPPRKKPTKARGPGWVVEGRDVDGLYYALAAEMSVRDAASAYLDLTAASFHLAGGTKSILFTLLRSRGLSYSYYVDFDVVGDTGYVLLAVESANDLVSVRDAVGEALRPRSPPDYRLAYFKYLWGRKSPSARALDYVEYAFKGGDPARLEAEMWRAVERGTENLSARLTAVAEAAVAPEGVSLEKHVFPRG